MSYPNTMAGPALRMPRQSAGVDRQSRGVPGGTGDGGLEPAILPILPLLGSLASLPPVQNALSSVASTVGGWLSDLF